MHRYLAAILTTVILVPVVAMGQPALVTNHGTTYGFQEGGLVSLRCQDGLDLVRPGETATSLLLHRLDGDHEVRADEEEQAGRFVLADGEAGTSILARYDADGDELVLGHAVTSAESGVWGVEWFIGEIPLEMNIIVPAVSGMKLTQDSPGRTWQFDYPISWTNQMVVVEGPAGGFHVWAEDTRNVFKRIAIERGKTGWRLGFTTMAFAPFDDKTSVPEVRWHVGVYEGDWRVPAKRYRDWALTSMRPVPVEAQTPAWVKDTRVCVIMGQDMAALELLAERVEPTQTLIYLPSWRAAGYDRNYPEYDSYLPNVRPFIERAHALGFRIMLHVNYFGVDPLHPVYAQFEPYQVRKPFGDHEKEWWLWERADPIIKFAYINPACSAWRDFFVARMVELRDDLKVDALHLDQTLCIYNDHNGLIEGMTMAQGALALHRQLREALPEVAISGEGLNEITMRYEAFAQRHAYGLNHADGTYHLPQLRMAHPIASYLMRPYTVLYGYLGCASPTSPEMYCAWDEAYRYWGIIPTLKPNAAALSNPSGFTRQFLDEARLWTSERVDPDLGGEWPPGVAFPYRTGSGDTVYDMADGRLLHGENVVSRTLHGVSTATVPGSISGWRGYNDMALIGLEPTQWYPCFDEPRDPSVLHVTKLPEGFTLGAVAETDTLAFIRTRPERGSDILLASLIEEARCGSRRFDGKGEEVDGPLYDGEDGAFFQPLDDDLRAHPPWKTGTSGVTFARYDLTLPAGATRFVAEVGLSEGAVGEDKSDGVTFGVTLRADGAESRATVHQADTQRALLALDMAGHAGELAVLELTVDPGPERSPSFDWARWYSPRVECNPSLDGEMTVAGLGRWNYALDDEGLHALEDGAGEIAIRTSFPGAAYFLQAPPAKAGLPFEFCSVEPVVTVVSGAGTLLENAAYAGVAAVTTAVGGVERRSLFAHPPHQGRTQADFPVTLPEDVTAFHAYAGLRDGSVGGDTIFIVAINGVELERRRVEPGQWQEITLPLRDWAGKPVVLSLITDSNGPHTYDWAHWGEPVLR